MNDDKKPATWSDVRHELIQDDERMEMVLDSHYHHTRWEDVRQQRIDQVGEEVYNGLVRQAAKEMRGLRRLPYCDGEACEPDGATVVHSRDCSIVTEPDRGEE